MTTLHKNIKQELKALLDIEVISMKIYKKAIDKLNKNIKEYNDVMLWEPNSMMIADYILLSI